MTPAIAARMPCMPRQARTAVATATSSMTRDTPPETTHTHDQATTEPTTPAQTRLRHAVTRLR